MDFFLHVGLVSVVKSPNAMKVNKRIHESIDPGDDAIWFIKGREKSCRKKYSNLRSFSAAFFVLFAATAGAGIVAADFIRSSEPWTRGFLGP